jgi:hypothetical protein
MFQRKVAGKIKTHILCSVTFFRKAYRIWENVEKCGRTGNATVGNTIRFMRLACLIAKARDTNSEHVILIAFALQQLLNNRASVLQVQCLSS